MHSNSFREKYMIISVEIRVITNGDITVCEEGKGGFTPGNDVSCRLLTSNPITWPWRNIRLSDETYGTMTSVLVTWPWRQRKTSQSRERTWRLWGREWRRRKSDDGTSTWRLVQGCWKSGQWEAGDITWIVNFQCSVECIYQSWSCPVPILVLVLSWTTFSNPNLSGVGVRLSVALLTGGLYSPHQFSNTYFLSTYSFLLSYKFNGYRRLTERCGVCVLPLPSPQPLIPSTHCNVPFF